MSDQSLSAVIRDADWGVIAYVELGRIHPGVFSGVVAESGTPKHVFLPGEANPISHVFFSKTELIKGEPIHLVDIANDGWKLFVGDAVFSKAGIPQVEITAEIDRYTQQSIAKINENANALFSRIKVAQGDIEELLHDLSIARTGVDGINAIIGKVVTLRSASDVKMTAARMADDGGVLCVWMHDGVVQSASIPLAALVDWP
jgi:uncharacterized protein YodC (DUF2158 family)